MTHVLDISQLKELEARWRAQGGPIVDALQPGLGDDEMQDMVSPLGLRLPREARQWWGWHDGVSSNAAPAARELGPGQVFLPLAEAVQECQRIRDLMRQAWPDESASPWRPSWLPITAAKRPLVVDCGVADGSPTPTRSFFFEDPEDGADGAASFGDLVSIWIEALDCGAWRYDRDQGQWKYHWRKLDPGLELRRLT